MSSGEETQELLSEISEELQKLLSQGDTGDLNRHFSNLIKQDLTSACAAFNSSMTILIESNKYDQVIDLVSLNPDLYEGQWPIPSILSKYISAISSNDMDDLINLIKHFGIYPKIKSKRGLNLFEEAIFSKSLSMVKFVRESFGVESKDEKALLEAASIGHKGILQYLYEEVGVEVQDSAKLVKNVLESGSLECLQYVRCYMGIGAIDDQSVVELALYQSVQTHRLDLLDYLITYFQIEFDPAKISPYKKNPVNKKNTCLFTSFHSAVVHNKQNILLFALNAVKIRIGSNKGNSDLLTYLELLNLCVKKNNFKMMEILIKYGKMCPSACLQNNSDDYVVGYIEKASLKKKDKIKMLEFLMKYDKKSDYELAIHRVRNREEEKLEIDSLKKIKREIDFNNYKPDS